MINRQRARSAVSLSDSHEFYFGKRPQSEPQVRLRLTWREGAAPPQAVDGDTLSLPMTEREAKRRARTYGDLGLIVAIAIEAVP